MRIVLLLFLGFVLLIQQTLTCNRSKPLQRPAVNMDRPCSLLIVIDKKFVDHFQRNITHITKVIQDLETQANNIFTRDIFVEEFQGIYFRVEEIRLPLDFNPECDQNITCLLEAFSFEDFSQFCLAHMLTYQDFLDEAQGISYVKALCSTKQRNFGITSLFNNGKESPFEQFATAFVHELGHNFGANHDDEADCNTNCIMNSKYYKTNRNSFSDSSKQSIKAHMTECFKVKSPIKLNQSAFCGNERGNVEGFKQCDCGPEDSVCADQCCYPPKLNPDTTNMLAAPCGWIKKKDCHDCNNIVNVFFVFLSISFLFALIVMVIRWDEKEHYFRNISSFCVLHLSRKPDPYFGEDAPLSVNNGTDKL